MLVKFLCCRTSQGLEYARVLQLSKLGMSDAPSSSFLTEGHRVKHTGKHCLILVMSITEMVHQIRKLGPCLPLFLNCLTQLITISSRQALLCALSCTLPSAISSPWAAAATF